MSHPDHDNTDFIFAVVCAGGDSRLLSDLLDSLETNSDASTIAPHQICVVENTTPPHDDQVKRLCHTRPNVTLIRPGKNFGYGAAINLAAESLPNNRNSSAQPSWLIVCNSDLIFPPDSFTALRSAVKQQDDDRVGLIAPRLLDEQEDTHQHEPAKTQPSIGKFPTLWSLLSGKLRNRRTRKYIKSPTLRTKVDWATGACLAVRLDAFREVGGFDHGFFLDYEDVDLCKRLASENWTRIFDPSWKVIHRHPHAQNRNPNFDRLIHTRASLIRYFVKHRTRWELALLSTAYRLSIILHKRNHPMQSAWRAGINELRKSSKPNSPAIGISERPGKPPPNLKADRLD